MEGFSSQITFLNFQDYQAGKAFFTQVLGLEPVYDIGWAVVYGAAGKAFLGAVKQEKPVRDHGTLVSLTTDRIEQWHRELSEKIQVSPIAQVPGGGLKSFFFEGPEGYRFEIQQFLLPELRAIF